jgi:hypothetical protein
MRTRRLGSSRLVRETGAPCTIPPSIATGCAGRLSGRRAAAQAAATATNRGTTGRVGTAHRGGGECGRTRPRRVRAGLPATPRLGACPRLNRRRRGISVDAAPQHLLGMTRGAGLGDGEAAVRTAACQAHVREPGQARPVLQSLGPANAPAQRQPMQRRATACFQIGLVPHAQYRPGKPDTMQAARVSRYAQPRRDARPGHQIGSERLRLQRVSV